MRGPPRWDDLAVVAGSIRDFRDGHPTTALLIVEVADSSLLHDRKRKIPLYARYGIPEAWLLNLPRRALEVYRQPVNGVYQARMVLRAGDTISPVSRPEASGRKAVTFSGKRSPASPGAAVDAAVRPS